MNPASFTFKIASKADEFDQIHRLNYRSFAEEIPQHPANEHRILIDKYHHLNTYVICLAEERLVGMLALNDTRPFSLDSKLPDLDSYLPPGRSIVEVRLLAIEREYRHHGVIQGLLVKLAEIGSIRGWDLGIISGTERQIKLYKHLGLEPFGPLVGTDGARFQPMYITLERFRKETITHIPLEKMSPLTGARLNLLPGPVAICREVNQAIGKPAVSHRSKTFMGDFQTVRERLCRLTNAKYVEIMSGSGTLANDAVGAQLALTGKPGIVLSNGEFGGRLIDHAKAWRLKHKVVKASWGEAIPLKEVEKAIKTTPGVGWLWMVHCETSSGIVNKLDDFKKLCRAYGLKLCIDCMSSLNIVPIDMRGIEFATSSSGKGLGAFPGLALVFHNRKLKPQPNRIPRYLDLGYYAAFAGVPFTMSSNLLYSLKEALQVCEAKKGRGRPIGEISHWLREEFVSHGYQLLGDEKEMSPAIITLKLPPHIDSVKVGDRLEELGCWISYRSYYLAARNLVQICLMGDHSDDNLTDFPDLLDYVVTDLRMSED